MADVHAPGQNFGTRLRNILAVSEIVITYNPDNTLRRVAKIIKTCAFRFREILITIMIAFSLSSLPSSFFRVMRGNRTDMFAS